MTFEPPKCDCGCPSGGLLFREDRWWCHDCVWAVIDRLRARTHEIQEAADRRNAKLHKAVGQHEQLMREAHDYLADFRRDKGLAWESLMDTATVAAVLVENQRLRAAIQFAHKCVSRNAGGIINSYYAYLWQRDWEEFERMADAAG